MQSMVLAACVRSCDYHLRNHFVSFAQKKMDEKIAESLCCAVGCDGEIRSENQKKNDKDYPSEWWVAHIQHNLNILRAEYRISLC